jgi:hypothetical protein
MLPDTICLLIYPAAQLVAMSMDLVFPDVLDWGRNTRMQGLGDGRPAWTISRVSRGVRGQRCVCE